MDSLQLFPHLCRPAPKNKAEENNELKKKKKRIKLIQF
jgi:hypothetical protein